MNTKEIDDILTFHSKPTIDEQYNSMGPNIRKLFERDTVVRTVLGIDIYHYSKYPGAAQDLIPYCFRKTYEKTLSHLAQVATAFFNKDDLSNMPREMISTGDGCYQIMQTPLQAVIFAIHFQANLALLNTGEWTHMISHLVPTLSLRYAITLDRLFRYEDNWFGPGIINNARILAADRLNRTLVSQNVSDWFTHHTNGVESLQRATLLDLGRTDATRIHRGGHSLIIAVQEESATLLRAADVLKISDITVKGDTASVYSIHLQVHMTNYQALNLGKYVITLGNLNAEGLTQAK